MEMMMNTDEEIQQACNDMLVILEESDLDWYQSIAALDLLRSVMIQSVEYEKRGTK